MEQNPHPVNVREFLQYSTDLLKNNGIKDARVNSELLLCDVLKTVRLDLYLNFDRHLNNDEVKAFNTYLNRRLNHEPLQYILGHTEFYGFEFIVNKNVLIPRPETELLVEMIFSDIQQCGKKNISVFEIGCGSGCISIALAHLLQSESITFDIFAIDSSQNAVDLAVENKALNGFANKKIGFYKKDVFEINSFNKSFDYIISNPPYISLDELKMLDKEVQDFEPHKALTDFGNGLKFYEKIFSIAAKENFSGKVFCEIGFGQREKIEYLLTGHNFKDYSFYMDYGNIERILEVIK